MLRPVLALGLGAALLRLAPAPAGQVDLLLSAPAGSAPTTALVALATLLAELLLAWLLLAVALTTGSRAAGSAGRVCDAALRRCAPAALRRLAAVLVGAGVALSVAGPASAAARPALDWPVAPPPAAAADLVVRPGDTLWQLAAARLPAGSPPAAVAAAWPAWWSANRAVIGDDPDLLLPGQHLVPPTPSTDGAPR